MPEPIIKVQHISKQYHIGSRERINKTFREALTDAFLAPVRNLINLRRMTRVEEDQSKSDIIWALKDINFSILPGEVVGIIGRNGAGKSTLLKILSRITSPTSGDIRLNGRISSLLEVGTGFHPELTGRENIYLNGTILGMRKQEIDRKFDEIIAFSEIEKFLDTPVKRYSSGMYVRLAFAVAAHLEPEILLVDEVLAVGDAAFQKKCLGKMGDVAKEGRTILFVSHNLAAVQALCSRSILLDSGKIVSEGETEKVITDYMQTGEQATATDIRSREDRSGTSLIRFTNIEFIDSQNNKIGIILSGQRLRIAIEYVTAQDYRHNQQLVIAIGINSLLGENLLLLSNQMTGEDINIQENGGRIICEIPHFPLTRGIYSINLYAELNGTMADWVKNAIKLHVESGDYFGSGHLPPSTHAKVLVSHTWYTE